MQNYRQHPLYKRWKKIKARTVGSKSKDYKRYGGRGIGMYEPWITDPVAFIQYCISLPSYDPTLQLDRIDNNGNYEPNNLRFVSLRENVNNQEQSVRVEYKGRDWSFYELETLCGIPRSIISSRVSQGWTVEKAITTPLKSRQALPYYLEYEGKIFRSLTAVVRYKNLNPYPIVNYRVNKGWPIEVALETPKLRRGEEAALNKLYASCAREEALAPYSSVSKHPLYKRLQQIRLKCRNPSDSAYRDYGGRGIDVYQGWVDNPHTFIVFMEGLGWTEGSNLTIDRIDNDGPYAPWNCRLATSSEQALNKRNTVKVDVFGECIPLKEAYAKYGNPNLSLDLVYRRIRRYGWPPEEALLKEISKERVDTYTIEYQGVVYPTLADFVAAKGVVTYAQAYHRYHTKGWDVIKAVTYEICGLERKLKTT